MYNFDSAKFQMILTFLEFTILSGICLLITFFGKKYKRLLKIKDFDSLRKFLFFTGIFFMILGALNFFYDYYSIFIANDSVLSKISTFAFEERPSHSGIDSFFVTEYIFIDENKERYCVTMDLFSKKSIFNDEFVKDQKYLISYTKTGAYIVGVKKITNEE